VTSFVAYPGQQCDDNSKENGPDVSPLLEGIGEWVLGVDFINMFTSSFYAWRSQKCKMTNDLTVIFALLESAHVKAVSKNVGEIDTWS